MKKLLTALSALAFLCLLLAAYVPDQDGKGTHWLRNWTELLLTPTNDVTPTTGHIWVSEDEQGYVSLNGYVDGLCLAVNSQQCGVSNSANVLIGSGAGNNIESSSANNFCWEGNSCSAMANAYEAVCMMDFACADSDGIEVSMCIGEYACSGAIALTKSQCLGYKACENADTSRDMVCIGSSACEDLIDDSYVSTCIGPDACRGSYVGDTVCIGHNACVGVVDTTRTFDSNVYIGNAAGNGAVVDMNNGYNNTAVGYAAGRIHHGHDNLILGRDSGQYADGDFNIFVGPNAGTWSAGDYNVFIGASVGSNPACYASWTAGHYLAIGDSNSCTPPILGKMNSDWIDVNTKLGLAKKTGDPCGALASNEGRIFWNSTSHYACVCDNAGAAKKLNDVSTNCF